MCKVSGWRLGWMIVPPHLIAPITSLQQNMYINAPTISQTAALHCWDDVTQVELQKHVQKYQTSRFLILDELAKLQKQQLQQQQPPAAAADAESAESAAAAAAKGGGLQIAPADGGFYVYVDLGPDNVALDADLGSVAFCQALLEEYHVAFTPGIDFENPATNLGQFRFRISYAGGIATAVAAMQRLHEFWPHWQERVHTAKLKQQQQQQQQQQQNNNKASAKKEHQQQQTKEEEQDNDISYST
jgi:aspartate/methionine/tyrosine aminotransferase